MSSKRTVDAEERLGRLLEQAPPFREATGLGLASVFREGDYREDDPRMTAVMVPTANAEVPHAEVVNDDPGDLSDASLPVLAKMADRYHAEAEAGLRTAQGAFDSALVAAWHSGRVLTEVKSRLKHGDFLPWVTQNTKISTRTAQRYMNVFEKAPRVSHLVGQTSIRRFLESHAEPKAAAKRKRKTKPIRPPSSAPHVKKWRTHIWQLQEHVLALNNLKDGKDFGQHRAAVMQAHADDVAYAKKIVAELDAVLSGDQDPFPAPEEQASELVEKIMAAVEELAEHIRNHPEMDSTAINMMLSTSATPLQRSLDGWLRNNFPALRHAIPADFVAAFPEAT